MDANAASDWQEISERLHAATKLVCEAQSILALKFPLSRPRADAKLASILNELAGSGYLFAPQLEDGKLVLPVIAR
jgi:hypothetical protein